MVFLGAVARKQRAALAVCNPVKAGGRAGGQQLLDNDIAFQRAAFMPAVGFRQGQPEPAACTEFARKIRIERVPAVTAMYRAEVPALLNEELAYFCTQCVQAFRHRIRFEPEGVYFHRYNPALRACVIAAAANFFTISVSVGASELAAVPS